MLNLVLVSKTYSLREILSGGCPRPRQTPPWDGRQSDPPMGLLTTSTFPRCQPCLVRSSITYTQPTFATQTYAFDGMAVGAMTILVIHSLGIFSWYILLETLSWYILLVYTNPASPTYSLLPRRISDVSLVHLTECIN